MADFLFLWLAQALCSLFCDFPLALGTEVVFRCFRWGYSSKAHLFSVFLSIVGFFFVVLLSVANISFIFNGGPYPDPL